MDRNTELLNPFVAKIDLWYDQNTEECVLRVEDVRFTLAAEKHNQLFLDLLKEHGYQGREHVSEDHARWYAVHIMLTYGKREAQGKVMRKMKL